MKVVSILLGWKRNFFIILAVLLSVAVFSRGQSFLSDDNNLKLTIQSQSVTVTAGDFSMFKTVVAEHHEERSRHSPALREKSRILLSGLQQPMNILNGTELVFPSGSLKENININIRLSNFSTWMENSIVRYTHGVVSGLCLDVTVGDSLVYPYFFEKPVRLSLPYKEDMLDLLGIKQKDLWMYFYTDSTGFEDDGITNISIDTEKKQISADIAHFSEVVVSYKNRPRTAVIRNQSRASRAQNFNLIGNYPNPFNPETQIRFRFSGSKPEWIRVTIYNLIGNKIRSLYNGYVENGLHSMNWDTHDDRGRSVSSGVYIVRLEGQYSAQAHKMLLMR
ncbi:T9SS type A sorting domain-containing protein [candidate division KSB1 bacterium]|nr:T9SS type A sorting domain-containing protein [candidate division KSB1 bacterium]